MSDSDIARRLSRLLKRPTMQDKDEDFLIELIEEATDTLLDYTHRTIDLGEKWDTLVVDLAVYRANQLGIEGSSRAGEGTLSRMYSDSLPAIYLRRMNQYRLIQGISEE